MNRTRILAVVLVLATVSCVGQAADFYPISGVTTSTANDYFPIERLYEGLGVGFDAAEPHDRLGTNTWVTAGGGADYIANMGMPVLEVDLGTDVLLSEISVWGYSSGNSNGISDFTLRFATGAEGPGGAASILYQPAFNLGPLPDQTPRHSFLFSENVTARYVELTANDNYYGSGVPGGDRVGLGEIAFMVKELDLFWNGPDGDWGHIDIEEPNHSGWVDVFGTPVRWFPDIDTPAGAIINANTVTVVEDRTALGLTVNGGGLAIADGTTLSVNLPTKFLPETTLSLGEGATLLAFGGGTLDRVTTAGNATISVGAGVMPLATLEAAAGTFAKQGNGTLALGAVTADAGTTFKVESGKLTVQGTTPFGDAKTIEMAGGSLEVAPILGDYVPGLAFGAVAGADNETDFPTSTTITVDLAETEGPIATNTTHVFHGRFYHEGGFVSFRESIDDNAFLKIDDVVWINDGDSTFAMTEWPSLWNNPNLDPGWHTFELRLGNAGGPGGPVDPPPGFGWDIVGGFDFIHFEDPGDGSVLMGPSYAPVNLSDKSLVVTGDSTVELGGATPTQLESLTLRSGILTVSGGGALFGATTIDATAEAVMGLDLQAEIDLGTLEVIGSEAITLVKAGPVDLVLTGNAGATALGGNATIELREGLLVGVHDTNPFGAATLRLDGGDLMLAGAATGTALFDNPVTVLANSTLTAGAAGQGASDVDITLGSPASGLVIESGTLTLAADADYRLEVAGAISGNGGLRIDGGKVTLAAGGTVHSADVRGGQVSLGADLLLQTLSVADAVVDTGDNSVTVDSMAMLGDTPFYISENHSFSIRGADLASNETARVVTVGGGTLEVGMKTIPTHDLVSRWEFNDGAGNLTAADSVGTNNGTLTNMDIDLSWTSGRSGAEGDSALLFDGTDDVVHVPFNEEVNPESFTVAAWVLPNSTAGYQSVFTSRYDKGPNADIQGYIVYNDNGDWSFWTGDGDPGWAALIGPPVEPGAWMHMAISFDADTNTKSMHINGVEVASSTAQEYVPNTLRDLHIGAGGDSGTQYRFDGTIDDVAIYDRALGAVEMAALAGYTFGEDGRTLELFNTDFVATDDTTLSLQSVGTAELGNLALDAGVTLTIADAAASVGDIAAGNGAKIDTGGHYLTVRGTLLPGDLPAELSVTAPSVTLAEGSTYAVSLGSTATDRLTVEGVVEIRANSTLEFDINGKDLFKAGTYTLIEAKDLEEGLIGEFVTVGDLKGYVSTGLDADGLEYTDRQLLLTIDMDLHPGDATLDTTTDVRDFNVWNTNKFTSGTDWTSGDFDGNGVTDVRDFNVWNTSKFTSATVPGAPVADGQVPEPGILILLGLALLGLLLGGSRRRRG